jgi:hypothetical protein
MKAFEVYCSSIQEERNYYKKKLKESKQTFSESKAINDMQVIIDDMKDELLETRKTNERLYKENMFLRNEM